VELPLCDHGRGRPRLILGGHLGIASLQKELKKTKDNAFTIVNSVPAVATAVISLAVFLMKVPILNWQLVVVGLWVASSLIVDVFCVRIFRRATLRRFRKLARESTILTEPD
jgi:hypothetical protein